MQLMITDTLHKPATVAIAIESSSVDILYILIRERRNAAPLFVFRVLLAVP